MTPEEQECADAMPVWFRPDGTLPTGAPNARRLSVWEKRGWIQIHGDPPRQRWALTAGFLARTRGR